MLTVHWTRIAPDRRPTVVAVPTPRLTDHWPGPPVCIGAHRCRCWSLGRRPSRCRATARSGTANRAACPAARAGHARSVRAPRRWSVRPAGRPARGCRPRRARPAPGGRWRSAAPPGRLGNARPAPPGRPGRGPGGAERPGCAGDQEGVGVELNDPAHRDPRGDLLEGGAGHEHRGTDTAPPCSPRQRNAGSTRRRRTRATPLSQMPAAAWRAASASAPRITLATYLGRLSAALRVVTIKPSRRGPPGIG